MLSIQTMAEAKNIFTKIKERWMRWTKKKVTKHLTALEQYAQIVKFINLWAYLAGYEFTNEWQLNRRISFVAFVHSVVWFLAFHTLYTDFPSLDDVVLLAGILNTFMIGAKLALVILNHKKCISLLNFIQKVFDENTSGNRGLILSNNATKISRRLKLLVGFLAFGISVYAVYPCYDFLFNGNLTKMSPMIVPIINEKELKGYLIGTQVNVVCISGVVLGSFGVNCLFFTMADAYDGLVYLIEDDFKMFDRMCEKNVHDTKRKPVFTNIVAELMDLARFNKFMNESFSIIASVECACCYGGIVCCLFGFFAVNFHNGIGAVAYFTTELLMVCYIGQLVVNTNERTVAVINERNWYIYDVKYQKDMLLVLNMFQNVPPILIAGVYSLNFETGLKMYKSIYSLTMFMLNFLE